MSKYWIDDPIPTIAYQCLDSGGYIPYSSQGGRMVTDDFGNLQQALPRDHYQEEPYHAFEVYQFH